MKYLGMIYHDEALAAGRPKDEFDAAHAAHAVHAEAPRAEATDWRQILALYDVLLRVRPSPVVELNRAAAVAMADGPARGRGRARLPRGAAPNGARPPAAVPQRRLAELPPEGPA